MIYPPQTSLSVSDHEPVKSQTKTMAANQTVCIFGSAKRCVWLFFHRRLAR